ncbi:hypothetical protein [Patulibacter minatonensis]|uniref:hypothetical protein n=1 Tax=Patulibacter minatonensis TaxID=298163 RepID=UPI00047D20DA|nr:hypothetical protein [Patulibacter minatonensis]
MKHWPEIKAAREAFHDLGERHGLQVRAGAVYAPAYFPGGAAVQVEVLTEDLVLLMLHAVPVAEGAAWISALHAVLDVPEGRLPAPNTWVSTTDDVVRHDRELDELPTAGV